MTRCDPCHGPIVPGCCHYPVPEQHTISVEVELDVMAVTPEDDDIRDQVEEALKAGEYEILTISPWHEGRA
ncbi:hypothetical protein ACWIB8_05235 [Corynebacterium flavescens]